MPQRPKYLSPNWTETWSALLFPRCDRGPGLVQIYHDCILRSLLGARHGMGKIPTGRFEDYYITGVAFGLFELTVATRGI